MSNENRLVKVGLTGGIGTGKSSVGERWSRQSGTAVIDADELAHQTLTPGTPTYDEIVKTFGKGILAADGTIRRAALAEIVFGNEQKRFMLNRIIHPAVRQMWTDGMARLEREGRTRCVVVSVPLLYEVGAENEFHCVVVVGCSEQTQLVRLAVKGMTEADARARIRAQWPLQMKMDRADFVIWNDGLPEVFHQQADIVWAQIKESYHAASKN